MSRVRSVIPIRVMFRLLAIAFWALGLVRASDAIRNSVQPQAPLWSWVDAIFGLCFFLIATILWLESKYIGIEHTHDDSKERQ
jgi:hypothetical protein